MVTQSNVHSYHAPEVPPRLPRRGNWLSRSIGKFFLLLLRWKGVGELPNVNKCVLIVAPHTSNWDFVIGISIYLAYGIDGHWFGKHTIFKSTFGKLLKWLGGIPVERKAQHGFVEQLIEMFKESDQMILALSPEGTRKKTKHWKKGYYYIALGAKVPIFLVSLDYKRRELEFGPLITPNGNYEEQAAEIKAYYNTKTPKKPDLF